GRTAGRTCPPPATAPVGAVTAEAGAAVPAVGAAEGAAATGARPRTRGNAAAARPRRSGIRPRSAGSSPAAGSPCSCAAPASSAAATPTPGRGAGETGTHGATTAVTAIATAIAAAVAIDPVTARARPGRWRRVLRRAPAAPGRARRPPGSGTAGAFRVVEARRRATGTRAPAGERSAPRGACSRRTAEVPRTGPARGPGSRRGRGGGDAAIDGRRRPLAPHRPARLPAGFPGAGERGESAE